MWNTLRSSTIWFQLRSSGDRFITKPERKATGCKENRHLSKNQSRGCVRTRSAVAQKWAQRCRGEGAELSAERTGVNEDAPPTPPESFYYFYFFPLG
jgi:hypothetical protein